jgi:hypothetical protein
MPVLLGRPGISALLPRIKAGIIISEALDKKMNTAGYIWRIGGEGHDS